ncbi:MAG: nucleotidyltransferase domain-containing protein [Bacteroidota bacterium]
MPQMNDQKARFQAAADEYVAKTQLEKDVIGIVVSGSFVHAELGPNSDIDIYVITDPSNTERERGNIWIHGVEIEYFKNPPQQIRAYFRKEKSPHTAHILANGLVAFQSSTEVEKLIQEAKAIMAQKAPALKSFQIELLKYGLDDLLKDYADSYAIEDYFAAMQIKHQIINHCIDAFCQIHRIYRTKSKRLMAQLFEIDSTFGLMIVQLSLSDWEDKKGIEKVGTYTANLLGGPRTKEWVLRSKLDL